MEGEETCVGEWTRTPREEKRYVAFWRRPHSWATLEKKSSFKYTQVRITEAYLSVECRFFQRQILRQSARMKGLSGESREHLSRGGQVIRIREQPPKGTLWTWFPQRCLWLKPAGKHRETVNMSPLEGKGADAFLHQHPRVTGWVLPPESGEEVKWKCWLFSRDPLFATPWTIACQAPLSMEFSRQEYWSGLPFPTPGDLPNPGIEPRSPALQADS